ncbi:MAG TPA: bifunctional riboflavin kinase/FAD synthetase [Actinomycetota bacterium]|nr:bifunctional riboflavin kinase/FAD synthetase [Actinomycetota bacterium]
MKLYRSLSEIPARLSPSAISVGNFDGVHRGHLKLINRLLKIEASGGGTPSVLSFDPHPQQVLRGVSPPALTTTEAKISLLKQAGVKRAFILPFDEEFSKLEPEDFASTILGERLNSRAVVVGANFRFGRFARGDVTMLRDLGKRAGYKVEGAPLVRVGGRTVSSTEIRHAIEAGELKWANRALGRAYRVGGTVVTGAKRGHQLGFPTANLSPDANVCLPSEGVYAGRAVSGRDSYKAAISVGINPTFGDGKLSIEAFILDFKGDLYGKWLDLDFVARIRGQVRFESAQLLASAMSQDIKAANNLLDRSSL